MLLSMILSCAQEYYIKHLNFLYSLKFLEALVVRSLVVWSLVVQSLVVRSLVVQYVGSAILSKPSSISKINQQLSLVIRNFLFCLFWIFSFFYFTFNQQSSCVMRKFCFTALSSVILKYGENFFSEKYKKCLFSGLCKFLPEMK